MRGSGSPEKMNFLNTFFRREASTSDAISRRKIERSNTTITEGGVDIISQRIGELYWTWLLFLFILLSSPPRVQFPFHLHLLIVVISILVSAICDGVFSLIFILCWEWCESMTDARFFSGQKTWQAEHPFIFLLFPDNWWWNVHFHPSLYRLLVEKVSCVPQCIPCHLAEWKILFNLSRSLSQAGRVFCTLFPPPPFHLQSFYHLM